VSRQNGLVPIWSRTLVTVRGALPFPPYEAPGSSAPPSRSQSSARRTMAPTWRGNMRSPAQRRGPSIRRKSPAPKVSSPNARSRYLLAVGTCEADFADGGCACLLRSSECASPIGAPSPTSSLSLPRGPLPSGRAAGMHGRYHGSLLTFSGGGTQPTRPSMSRLGGISRAPCPSSRSRALLP
jgi:hypothetical protein